MKRKYINLIIMIFVFMIAIDVKAVCSSNGSTDPGCASKSCNQSTKTACQAVNGQYAKCCKWTESTTTGCKTGYKKENGVCKIQCSDGYTRIDNDTCQINCSATEKRIDNNTCKACATGYIANSDHSDCVVAPIDSLSGGNDSIIYLAADEKATVFSKYIAKNSIIGSDVIVSWSYAGSGYSFSYSKNEALVKPTSLQKGTGSSCYNNKITVTASNAVSSLSTTKNICVYSCGWSAYSGAWKKNGKISLTRSGSNSGCIFYTGESDDKYSVAYDRCCGSKPPQDYGACYGDEPYYGIAKNVQWRTDNNPSGIYKYRYDTSVISDESKCVTMPQGNKCTVGDVLPQVKEISTNKCEDTVSFSVDSLSRKCGDGNNSFYTISCSRNVTVDFDYGDDDSKSTSRVLIRGLGFQFGIDVTSNITCKATFNSNAWSNEYNKVMNRLKNVIPYNSSYKTSGYQAYQNSKKSSNPKTAFEGYVSDLKKYDGSKFTTNTASYLYELYTLASDLEDIVTSYNDYNLAGKYDEQATLDMSYALKGNNSKTSYNYTFDSEEVCSPNNKKVESVKHTQVTSLAPWLTAPSNYDWTYKRVVSLYPNQTYIDKTNGTIKDNSQNALDGGNKIYIDYNANEGQTISPINIRVTGLAGNNSSVTNNKCSIDIKKVDILYRPIDVSNPFINSSWKTGDNWSNNIFDFRNIIDKNIWSK